MQIKISKKKKDERKKLNLLFDRRECFFHILLKPIFSSVFLFLFFFPFSFILFTHLVTWLANERGVATAVDGETFFLIGKTASCTIGARHL